MQVVAPLSHWSLAVSLSVSLFYPRSPVALDPGLSQLAATAGAALSIRCWACWSLTWRIALIRSLW